MWCGVDVAVEGGLLLAGGWLSVGLCAPLLAALPMTRDLLRVCLWQMSAAGPAAYSHPVNLPCSSPPPSSLSVLLSPSPPTLTHPPTHTRYTQFDESLIASLANEDLVDSLLSELKEDFPMLLKPLLHDR